MDNCFTYTYKILKEEGINVPKEWNKYTDKDMKLFIKEYRFFLLSRLHYAFFESFCTYKNEAAKNDIIIDDNSIGIAVNKYKYMTIDEKNGKPTLENITKDKKILRANNG